MAMRPPEERYDGLYPIRGALETVSRVFGRRMDRETLGASQGFGLVSKVATSTMSRLGDKPQAWHHYDLIVCAPECWSWAAPSFSQRDVLATRAASWYSRDGSEGAA